MEFTHITYLGKELISLYHFRSPIDYYIFLVMRFISENPNVAWCKCCGRYFIPKTKKQTKYCARIIRNGKTCKELAPVLKYNRDLAQWERQVQEKQKPAEKQSVRERLRQLQAEGKQKPNRRKSFDRVRLLIHRKTAAMVTHKRRLTYL